MADVGVFNPLLGQSYTEIASESRSQHKSQGFGSTGSRGSTLEFLEFRKGDEAEDDLFEGIDITWNRVNGGAKIASQIQSVIEAYDFSIPSKIVPETNLACHRPQRARSRYRVVDDLDQRPVSR